MKSNSNKSKFKKGMYASIQWNKFHNAVRIFGKLHFVFKVDLNS